MKPEINIHNYESYLLDYLEGRLNEEQAKKVEQFLALHPEIAEEIEQWHLIKLEPESISLDKSKLKKEEEAIHSFQNRSKEEWVIAALEGDLDDTQLRIFKETKEKDPELNELFRQMKKIKLAPDNSIQFPYKEGLKKKTVVVLPSWLRYGVAAASLLLFAYFGYKVVMTSQPSSRPMSHESTPTEINQSKTENVSINKTKPILTENNNLTLETNEMLKTTKNSSPALALNDEMKNISREESQEIDIQKSELNNQLNTLKRAEVTDIKSDLDKENTLPVEKITKKGYLLVLYDETPQYSGTTLKLDEYLSKKVKEDVLKIENPERKITLWDVLSAGVRKISQLTGRNYELLPEYQDNGKLELLAFSSNRVQFKIPINKND